MNFFPLAKKDAHSSWVGWVCVLLGAATFFAVLGPLILNPTNIGWLGGGFDPTQHYLGWVFFRNSDWSFPIGLNPAFGMDISSSIVYSDSIPLLAFIFKLFAAVLPEPFQYFGWWLLLCFILQAYFAWRLIALLQMPSVATIGSVLLFVFSPVMFWRIGMHGALVAHWLILAALYLNFRPSRAHRLLYWGLLLSASALVHFYLLTMVLGLWVASLIDDGRRKINIADDSVASWRTLGMQVITIIFIVLVVMWQAGYFVVSQSASATLSYGVSRMNLLAPIDAHHWSYVLPSLPDAQGTLSDLDMSARTYENMMFWGAGVLLLFVVAFIASIFRWRAHTFASGLATDNPVSQSKVVLQLSWSQHGALYMALIAFTLFALSNQLAIGNWSWSYSLPQAVYEVASMYRASSRFFWPVFYTCIFLAIALVARYLPSRKITLLLLACAVIQIADTRSGWVVQRNLTMRPIAQQLPTELRDPFWEQAGRHYQSLVRIPVDANWVRVLPPHWSTFAYYAAQHGMHTNSAYLARQSAEKLEQSQLRLQRMLVSGQWDQKTLYILSPQEVRAVLEKANPKQDLLANINGHIVFAPGWISCVQCPPVDASVQITPAMVQTQIGSPIEFASAGHGKYFFQGGNWAYPESWGVWAVGQRAELALPLPRAVDAKAKTPTHLVLQMRALVNPTHPKQEILIDINGQAPVPYVLERDDHNQITIPLSSKVQEDGYVQLVFDLPTAKRPKDIGIGDDERLLSIGLISATLH